MNKEYTDVVSQYSYKEYDIGLIINRLRSL